tara:strand:- start:1718 stop:2023 length:306 start_codon:yes stop_codon:yes gene_type:complete
MHAALICFLGLFLPFAAFHGSLQMFRLIGKLTTDLSIPFVAAFNMVILTTLFPWLIIDDFVGPEFSALLFKCMLVGTMLAVMIEVLAPEKQKATNAPRSLS